MDSKTPAQVAEECEREARSDIDTWLVVCNGADLGSGGPPPPKEMADAVLTSITRALAARAWATAVKAVELVEDEGACPIVHGLVKAERDRLRREFEEASK